MENTYMSQFFLKTGKNCSVVNKLREGELWNRYREYIKIKLMYVDHVILLFDLVCPNILFKLRYVTFKFAS